MSLSVSIILIIIVGLGASTLASVIGLGGGLVAIPFIMLVVGGNHPNAAKLISYVNLVFISLISALKYAHMNRKPKWREALFIMIGVIPLTVISSIYITPLFDHDEFKPYYHLAYVIVAISVSALMYFKDKLNVNIPKPWLLAVMGGGIGLLSGTVGLSGGVLFVPILVVGMKMKIKDAAVTSLLLKLSASLTNVFTNISTGEFSDIFPTFNGVITSDSVPWILVIVILAGSFIGSQIGPLINQKMPEEAMQKLFFAVMALIVMWEGTETIYSLVTGSSIL